MSEFLFSNFASSVLTTAVPADATTLPVALGDGDKFPNPGPSTAFRAVLTSIGGAMEVVECTSRAGDNLVVRRAQEATAALAFAAGSRIELRLTAEVCRSFLQLAGGTMAGDLDMNGNEIRNAVFPTESKFTGGLRATSIKGLTNIFGIDFNSGRLPMIAGSEIITLTQLRLCMFPFWGTIAQMPYWFKICDGTNNTPDMRGRFIRGTSVRTAGEPLPGTIGGAPTTGLVNTQLDGAINKLTNPTNLHAGNIVPLVVNKSYRTDIEGAGSNTLVEEITIAYGPQQIPHDHRMIVDAHDHQVNVTPASYWMFFVMFKDNLIPP